MYGICLYTDSFPGDLGQVVLMGKKRPDLASKLVLAKEALVILL